MTIEYKDDVSLKMCIWFTFHNMTYIQVDTQWSGCLKKVSRHPQHVFKIVIVDMSFRQYVKDMLAIARCLEIYFGDVFETYFDVFECLQGVLRYIFQDLEESIRLTFCGSLCHLCDGQLKYGANFGKIWSVELLKWKLSSNTMFLRKRVWFIFQNLTLYRYHIVQFLQI